MTDDTDTDPSTAARTFVEWLAADIDGHAPAITLASATEVLPAAFEARLALANPPVVLMLARLCEWDDLSKVVLARCGEAIRTALSAAPLDSPREVIVDPPSWGYHSPDNSFKAAVYLVLRLSPSPVSLSSLSKEDLEFFFEASKFDPTMMRYWLAPVSLPLGQPRESSGIATYKAQLVKSTVLHRDKHGWSWFDWSSDRAQAMARRMAGAEAAAGFGIEPKRFFASLLTFLLELGKLNQQTARTLADRSTVSTFCAWIERVRQHRIAPRPNPTLGPRPMPEWVRAALRVLPLDELERDLNRLHEEEDRFERGLGDGVDRHHDDFFHKRRTHLQSEILTIGWAIGALLNDTERPVTIAEVRQVIQRWDEASLLGGVALLWATCFGSSTSGGPMTMTRVVASLPGCPHTSSSIPRRGRSRRGRYFGRRAISTPTRWISCRSRQCTTPPSTGR